ncbi:hypothetical protein KJR58_24395, partial [Escherichia coli]|nr:hypothetical protein [Escherichia coli]
MHIAMALLSAAMFFVLAGVFMGVQLELDGPVLLYTSDAADDTPLYDSVGARSIKKKKKRKKRKDAEKKKTDSKKKW